MAHADRTKLMIPVPKMATTVNQPTPGITNRPVTSAIPPPMANNTTIQPKTNKVQAIVDDRALNDCGIS